MFKCFRSGICAGLAVAVAMSVLMSCETKQGSGALIGGSAGALIGSQFGGSGGSRLLGAGIGGIVGALAGSYVGKSLDEKDREHMQRTTHKSLESAKTGHVSEWKNPDTEHRGTFTPTRTYKSTEGRYCREYTQTVTVGGQTEKAYGTACRQADGHWEIVK